MTLILDTHRDEYAQLNPFRKELMNAIAYFHEANRGHGPNEKPAVHAYFGYPDGPILRSCAVATSMLMGLAVAATRGEPVSYQALLSDSPEVKAQSRIIQRNARVVMDKYEILSGGMNREARKRGGDSINDGQDPHQIPTAGDFFTWADRFHSDAHMQIVTHVVDLGGGRIMIDTRDNHTMQQAEPRVTILHATPQGWIVDKSTLGGKANPEDPPGDARWFIDTDKFVGNRLEKRKEKDMRPLHVAEVASTVSHDGPTAHWQRLLEQSDIATDRGGADGQVDNIDGSRTAKGRAEAALLLGIDPSDKITLLAKLERPEVRAQLKQAVDALRLAGDISPTGQIIHLARYDKPTNVRDI